jgi:hypothetical protein
VPQPVPSGTDVPVNRTSDTAGNHYNFTSDTVLKTTPTGSTATIATAQIYQPSPTITVKDFTFTSVVVDSLGNVYAAETNNGLGGNTDPGELIIKITPSGTITTFPVNITRNINLATPNCQVAVDDAGNVFTIAPDFSIRQVQPDGTLATVALQTVFNQVGGSNGYPVGLAAANGHVFTNGSIYGTNYRGAIEFVPQDPTQVGPVPIIVTGPQSTSLRYGGTATLSVTAASTLPLSYQWQYRGTDIPGATGPSYTVNQAGTYSVVVSTSAGFAIGGPVDVTLANRMINISTRTRVGVGAERPTAGFVVADVPSGTKRVLVRAVGPTLAQFGITGVIARPTLTVFNSSAQPIATNAGWNNSAAVASASDVAGAFPLATNSTDAALVLDLPAGAYTALVSGADNTTGVALIEVYEVGPENGHFVNVSTLAMAGTGDAVLVGGLVTHGPQPTRVLFRAGGPSLTTFGLTGVLQRPVLTIYNSNGEIIGMNAGWNTVNVADAVTLAATASKVGAFPFLPGSADCALILTLPQGAYTAQVTGVNGATGIAIVEAYQVPE